MPSNLPLCLSFLDIQFHSVLCGRNYIGSGILLYTFLYLFSLDSVIELCHIILQLILWFPKPPWKYASYKSQINKINYLLTLFVHMACNETSNHFIFSLKMARQFQTSWYLLRKFYNFGNVPLWLMCTQL